jgi:hypothetical protein
MLMLYNGSATAICVTAQTPPCTVVWPSTVSRCVSRQRQEEPRQFFGLLSGCKGRGDMKGRSGEEDDSG